MATRTEQDTLSLSITQGALYKAARIAREMADRLEKGGDHLRGPAADGGFLVPASYQEAYALKIRDALRDLLREMDSPA